MFCKNCGTENAEGVKFCTSCGAPMSEETAAETAQPEEAFNGGMPTAPGAVNGIPMPMGQPGGQPVVQGGMQGNMQGNMPGNMPGGMQPNMPYGGAQGGAPGGMPGGAPNGMPNSMPGMPGAYNGMQGGMQGSMPGNMPGGMPMGMPGSAPMQSGPMYQMPPMAVPPAQPKKSGGGVKALIIIIVVLLLVCVGVLAAMGISKRMKQNKLDNCIETAKEYILKEDYKAAISSYQDALEIDEENSDAINGMTDAYVDWAYSLAAEGKYEEALDVLENADSRAKKKKISTAIEEIEAAMMVGSSEWTEADFVFTSDSESITVSLGHYFRVNTYYEESYLADYYGNYDDFDELFVTSRGLAPGMTLNDYINLYDLQPGYAVWERYSGDNGEYTSFMNYTGQSGYEMYDGYVNVWLDTGYCKENGQWRILEDWEVREIWFCDAPLNDYDEVVILSVNVYENDIIWDISMEHFTYDEDWVYWQDWAD
ncbi:MAG: zinc-ribbon domain-containing protein [Lachnospiraceae bacterium]|nr:zinc-ribbon domain-containing protein [Lachnospiraceae bacterium]